MEITDIRIKLSRRTGNRVKAFATMTLDESFVVRDMRVIEGNKGLFVAMPSRPVKDPCPKCSYRNQLSSKYCANCGGELQMDFPRDERVLHRDVAHPITQNMREYIQNKVIDAYKAELEKESVEPAPPSEEQYPVEAPDVEPEEKSDIEIEQKEDSSEEKSAE